MKRTTVFLDEGLESDLQSLARRSGSPVSSLVREALSRYVQQAKKEQPFRLRFLGVGRSGHSDTAERNEELLFRDLSPHGARAPATRRARRESPGRRRS